MGAQLAPAILILDSWPVLEWMKGREPASSHFGSILKDALAQSVKLEMTRINYGEVIYNVRKANDLPDREMSLRRFLSIPIRVHSISDALVDEAVELTSKYPFSFADGFAAAQAIRLRSPLVTGDLEFRKLEADGLLQLHWVGA